jgi:beta-fructofuranosidase
MHLPVAIWSDHAYDSSGVWTGSTTVVDGIPIIMFPGLNATGPETMNLAKPSNLSDPFFTNWTMSEHNPIMPAGHDWCTAWKTKEGEWRTTNLEGAIFSSYDFTNWKRLGQVFDANECPELFERPRTCDGCPTCTDEDTDGDTNCPTHIYKRSNQRFDGYMLGNYEDGAPNTTGVWQNTTVPIEYGV